MSAENQYPRLTQHRIAKPCKVKWTDMSGDERKRFCGQCKLNVYNLSAMTSADAESLLQKTNGRICTYFYQRADGTVLTQDCPIGVRDVYRHRGAIAAALYALSLLFALPFARAGDSVKGDVYYPRPELLGGAPPPMPGEAVAIPQVEPSPTPTPTPTATPQAGVSSKLKRNCPRPLMGKPHPLMGRTATKFQSGK